VTAIEQRLDEGFRTIEVWESEQAWEHFQAERLAPAIAALGGPARPEPTFRGLHPAHVVVGTAIAEREALYASSSAG
jgi:hypothetical protein